MIPPPFLDWVVWANLDQHRDMELILLKGHLLVEITLSVGLGLRTSLSESQVKSLSFSAKTKALAAIDEQWFQLMGFVRNLNRLRNKLAHEPFPDGLEAELGIWSDEVLSALSVQKHQKYTRRTKVTQAFAALARAIYELSHIDLSSTPSRI